MPSIYEDRNNDLVSYYDEDIRNIECSGDGANDLIDKVKDSKAHLVVEPSEIIPNNNSESSL